MLLLPETFETGGASPVSILGREASRCHVKFSFRQMIVEECYYIIGLTFDSRPNHIISGMQQLNADLQLVSEIVKPTLTWCAWSIIVLMLIIAWYVALLVRNPNCISEMLLVLSIS